MARPQRQRRAPAKFEAGSSSEHAKALKEMLGKTFRYTNSVPIRKSTSDENDHAHTPTVKPTGAGSIVKEVSSRAKWSQIGANTLVQLCNEAVRRKTLKTKPAAKTYEIPLSEDFIRARIDVDDLVKGWMVFDAKTGRIQGFLAITQFTTWVNEENFKWENSPYYVQRHEVSQLVEGLNACPRSGNPFERGCVWPDVAEVSLFGAMGCGSMLLQEILYRLQRGDIRNAHGQPFKFVVLQATKNAEPFYSRQGMAHLFCRARHFVKRKDGTVSPKVGPWLPYRHFEYTAEDTEPSYMMGLDLRSLNCRRPTPGLKWKWVTESQPWPEAVLRRYLRSCQRLNIHDGIQPLQKRRRATRRGKRVARALANSPHFCARPVPAQANHKENVLGNCDTDSRNDDFCFKCLLGGTLLCCDSCSKAYHLSCINLQELPSGDWSCEDHLKLARPRRKRGRPRNFS